MRFQVTAINPQGETFEPPTTLARLACKFKAISLVAKLQDQYGPGFRFFLTCVY